MKRRHFILGSLLAATAWIGGTAMAAVASAAPFPAHSVTSNEGLCFSPSVGLMDYQVTYNEWSTTVGDVTRVIGFVRLTNLGNGHSHIFLEAGTETAVTSGPTGAPGTSYRGSFVVQSRGDISYLAGTGTTALDTVSFGAFVASKGLLVEACNYVV